jgi:hypothetical protein
MRQQKGSSLSELGPAMLVLLFALFLPFVNLVSIGGKYCACAVLNDLQTRKAVLLPKSQATDPAGPVASAAVSEWESSALGAFAHPLQTPETSVSYGDDGTVYVSTTFSVMPLLALPMLGAIPAAGGPVTFTISSSGLIEDPGNRGR